MNSLKSQKVQNYMSGFSDCEGFLGCKKKAQVPSVFSLFLPLKEVQKHPIAKQK
jgi:hypothetical protein